MSLKIICDTTLTLVDTSGFMDKLRVSVPSIRLGLLIFSHHTENYCTVLCCSVCCIDGLLLFSLCIGVAAAAEFNRFPVFCVVQFTFYWHPTHITGIQPTQPYRRGTCCFASVTMPHTLYNIDMIHSTSTV